MSDLPTVDASVLGLSSVRSLVPEHAAEPTFSYLGAASWPALGVGFLGDGECGGVLDRLVAVT